MYFGLWLEAKTSEFLERNPNSKKVEEWLLGQKEIKDFLSHVDRVNLVKPKVGKSGYLVMSRSGQHEPFTNRKYYDDFTGNSYQHRIPVTITNLQGNEAEIVRSDGKTFEEIAYKVPHFPNPREKKSIIVPLNRISIVSGDQHRTYLNWLITAVIQGAKKNNISIPKYFKANWETVQSSLISSLSNSQIQSRFKTTDLTFDDLVDPYKEVSKQHRGKEGSVGRPIIDFPNGFKWVSLDKESCSQEGNAAGHCGNNGAPQPGDNILSLRDKDNRVYLTFVINNGILVERKANGNNKPPSDLHPYIIELLKNPLVKSIKEDGRYLSERDFHISDLSYNNLIALSKARPDLVKVNKVDLLFAKYNQRKVISKLKEKYPVLKDVTGYDKEDHALIIGNGEHINTRKWDTINQTLEMIGEPYDTVRDTMPDLPANIKKEIDDYLKLEPKDPNYYGKISRAINKDPFFKKYIDLCMKEAHRKSFISAVNKDLLETTYNNVYYKLFDENNYIIAYKMLRTKDIKSDDINVDITPEIGWHHNYDVQVDYMTEAMVKNIRMLIYL